MNQHDAGVQGETAGRQSLMRICTEAAPDEVVGCAVALVTGLPVEDLRRPETGLVMLRGRMGGDGAAFNLGEATVTRAAVKVGGRTGFAYHLGRDARKARHAAILDALWQEPARRDAVEAGMAPVRARLAAQAVTAARRTAATRVDFFTLVRGED